MRKAYVTIFAAAIAFVTFGNDGKNANFENGFGHEDKSVPILGYQLDISRCKVPNMVTLFRIAEPDKPNFRAMFEPEYRRLWLRQNRLGGLKDSIAILFGM